jgi:hypothetical protein
VPYPDGFPDFQVGGYVQASVEIVQQGNRTSDFSDATAKNGRVKPPGTIWHHHQNRTTMQAVDIKIHRRFTHKGGVSIKKNSEKP